MTTSRTNTVRTVKRPKLLKPYHIFQDPNQAQNMPPKPTGPQGYSRLSEPPRASSSDLRRERARLAQQRSRARTRTELQTLQNRVQSLSTAIDQMTKIFLDFTNEVLAHATISGSEQDVRRIRDYMERFLATAHNVSDADDTPSSEMPSLHDDMSTDPSSEAADSGAESHFPIYSNSPHSASITSYPHTSSTNWADVLPPMMETTPPPPSSYSPRLSHGLLLPAPDMETPVAFRQSPRTRPPSFSHKLYWHCLRFGYSIIVSNGPAEVALASNIFYYGLRHDPRDVIATRLRRALARIPERIPLYMSTPVVPELPPIPGHSQVASRTGQAIPPHPNDVNEEVERANLKRSHEKIVESMYLEGDSIDEYLDSRGVQSRLLNTWGIDATAESAQEDMEMYGFASDPEDLGERPVSRAASTPSSSTQAQVRSATNQSSRNVVRPSAQVEALRQSETLPFQNVPAPIRHMWTAEAMTNLWSSVIMKLCMEARCLGNRPGFPIRAVDEVARGVLLASSA